MDKTKIDWADMSWNPVTGCLHNCNFCYARRIANRFGKYTDFSKHIHNGMSLDPLYVLDEPIRDNPYPFLFEPTFHRYRLGEPARKTRPRNIFVCSMGELFHESVPDEWIQAVFAACEAAPQHRYLFLTKNPRRYCQLANEGKLPENDNFWYGTTITKNGDVFFGGSFRHHAFLSAEPLIASLNAGVGSVGGVRWIIIGAETGNRKDKVIPKREWIENIVETAGITKAAIFMKSNLRDVWGEDLIQEYPWETKGETV